jgi:regulator of nucleoside diphosphate kinase
METMLLETTTVIRALDYVRLREWLNRLTKPEQQTSEYVNALRRKLCDAKVVALGQVPRETVTMNSLVGLRDLELDEKLTCVLSYPDDANLLLRRVSVAVPLGTEMLGRPAGAIVAVPAGRGIRQWRIESVYYQPEAAGDYHL